MALEKSSTMQRKYCVPLRSQCKSSKGDSTLLEQVENEERVSFAL